MAASYASRARGSSGFDDSRERLSYRPRAMRARRRLAALAALGTVLSIAAIASADEPSIARPRYEGADEASSGVVSGTAFFLATPRGAVAVGASHSFDRAKLAASSEISFELGRTKKLAGRASRVLVEPGLSFSAPGGTLVTDLVVFALDAPPAGVRVLEAGELPREGARVRLLGIPANNPHDEDDIFGTVVAAAPDRLEVLLDVFYDLRGWGGAPLLSHPDGRVLGLVQAATPDGRRLRVTATPIGVVTRALARPLDDGRGRAFASLAPPGVKIEPAPAAPARPKNAVVLETPGAPQKKVVAGELALEIEHPSDGAVIGDELGAFVSGRATDDLTLPKIEVVFVIDTSGSTSAPSGMDVNGNGVVGDDKFSLPGVISLGSTDPGDSVLAAEIAAARQFLAKLDPRYTRVCLVTFAGRDLGTESFEQIDPDSVRTEVALTNQYRDVERALERVLQRGAAGATYMSGAADQATVELLGLKGSLSSPDPKAEKLVVFLTDGQPTMPRLSDPDAAVLRAARRARRAGIRFFTSGIGEEALARPGTITRLAEITEGTFTAVRDASRLGDLVADVDLAGIASVTLQNETTHQPASAVELASDGGFGAMVPLAPGKNQIVVTATGTDGRVASKTITLQYAPNAQSPTVPPDLIARRNRLLEERLIELKRARLEVEDQKTEKLRRELEVEIQKAREERRKKELELKVEKKEAQPESVPAPAPSP